MADDDRSVNVGGNNSGVINTGDNNNFTVNSKVRRTLGDEMKSGLLRDFPRGGKPIQVLTQSGDQEARNFGAQIKEFLSQNGFPVEDYLGEHQFFNPPIFNVKINKFNAGRDDEKWHVVVGPAE